MHLLLPPSEAKHAGGRGARFGERLAAAEGPVADARRELTEALLRLVDGPPDRAARALLLPAGVADDALAANAAVLGSRTVPALRRYAGVVYDGLDHTNLDDAARRQAGRRVLVFSGLLGVVRGDEPVPNYRVPAKAELPGVGVAGTFWRPRLVGPLDALLRRGLVVDLRSGDYAAMWHPAGTVAERVVSVRILSPAPRGGHAVISYTSKFMKGRLAAALLTRAGAGDVATSVDDVLTAWRDCGGVAGDRDGTRVELYTG